MATRVPARLTAAEGRRFGVTVGLAFGAFALLFVWRHKPAQAVVAGSLGIALIGAGLALPTFLGPVQRAWMGLAHLISRVTTPLFMGIIYFLVVTPIGFVRRFVGGSPLAERERTESRWAPHTPVPPVREQMERQF